MTSYDLGNPLIQSNAVLNSGSHQAFLDYLEITLTRICKRICANSKKISGSESFQVIKNYIEAELDKDKKKELIHHLEKRLEDDISLQIVSLLNECNLIAYHDAYHNGHVDILIETTDRVHKWLGEAKLYEGNKYLQKGLFQLTQDYSTGDPNESGGVLIYLNSTSYPVQTIMTNWQNHLVDLSSDTSNRLHNFSSSFLNDYPLVLISEHDHHRTGVKYKIRHACLDIRVNI